MRIFFSFFGGKWRAAPKYPEPSRNVIVEPFAGSAGYSTRHYRRDVILCDIDPVIAGVWRFLIAAHPNDIRQLPVKIEHVDEIQGPIEAKHLVGFWLNVATTSPCSTPGRWLRDGTRPNSKWGEAIRERIATQVPLIKHWKIIEASYDSLEKIDATWFVDPPYNNKAGRLYRHKPSDYLALGSWCRSLPGQVMVCEQQGADWLPFEFLGSFKSLEGSRGKHTTNEVLWRNETCVT